MTTDEFQPFELSVAFVSRSNGENPTGEEEEREDGEVLHRGNGNEPDYR
jgi:hypothetical protein